MSRVNCETYVKKVQRRVNALIKRQNEALAEDELWLGRFYIRQLRRDVWKFEDGSGACVSFLFEIADKKTGKRDICRLDNYELRVAFKRGGGSWILFEALNDFIIKKVDVWIYFIFYIFRIEFNKFIFNSQQTIIYKQSHSYCSKCL